MSFAAGRPGPGRARWPWPPASWPSASRPSAWRPPATRCARASATALPRGRPRSSPRTNETGAVKGGYSTRQSNLSPSGGGAIYGCRANDAAASNPCLRGNNLSNGLAFEFNTVNGESAGTITAGAGGDTKRPFTTNATGVATGLNADEVDGLDASQVVGAARARENLDADTVDGADAGDLRTRWLLVDEQGQIEEQSGGFTIVDAYQTNQNVYIDAGSALDGEGLSASIAIQNKIDQSGDGTRRPELRRGGLDRPLSDRGGGGRARPRAPRTPAPSSSARATATARRRRTARASAST